MATAPAAGVRRAPADAATRGVTFLPGLAEIEVGNQLGKQIDE